MILTDSIKHQSVYCIGRNYKAHISELGNPVPDEPVVFLKSNNSLRGASGDLAFSDETFHHEAEIVLKIEEFVPMGSAPGLKACHEICLGLDLTRREVQGKLKEKGLPWTLAKSFKGSAVIGPWIPVPATWDSLEFTLEVEGSLRQTGHTSLMIFSFAQIINYLSSFQDLVPGDLIFTGTPEGVGPIRAGESFVLGIESLDYEFRGVL